MNLLSRSLLLVVVLLAPSCVFADSAECKLPSDAGKANYNKAKTMDGELCDYAHDKDCFVVLPSDKYLPADVVVADDAKKSFKFHCDDGIWSCKNYKGKSGEALDKMFLKNACDTTVDSKQGKYVDEEGKSDVTDFTVAADTEHYFKCTNKSMDPLVKVKTAGDQHATLKCSGVQNNIQGKWKATKKEGDKAEDPATYAKADGFCNAANSVKPGMLVALLVTVVTFVGVNL